MDYDTPPRATLPPKHPVMQCSPVRHEVPEVSVMFDSDDSLIWHRPGTQKSHTIHPSSEFQQQKTPTPVNALPSGRTPPIGYTSSASGKENNPYSNFMPFKTPVQRFISKSDGSSPTRQSSPVSPEERTSTSVARKEYNPVLYSPSQRRSEESPPLATVRSSRQVSPLALRNENVPPKTHASVTNKMLVDSQTDGEVAVNDANINGNKHSQSLSAGKRGVNFIDERFSNTTGTSVRTKPFYSGERESPLFSNHAEQAVSTSAQSEMHHRDKNALPVRKGSYSSPPLRTPPVAPPSASPPIALLSRSTPIVPSSGQVPVEPLTRSVPLDLPTRSVPVEPLTRSVPTESQSGTTPFNSVQNPSFRYGYSSSNQKANDFQQVNDSPIVTTKDILPSYPQVLGSSATTKSVPPYPQQIPGTVDSSIYKLIEDQSQHIANLYKTLEFLTAGNRKNENQEVNRHHQSGDSSNCKCSHVTSIGIQTSPVQPVMQSVGTNTDLSWPEILSLAKLDNQQYQRGTPVCHRSIDEDDSMHSPKHPVFRQDNRSISKARNGVGFDQRRGAEVKEIAVTMREVVMTTIQEDQPNSGQSLSHSEKYREDCECESPIAGSSVPRGHGNCERLPELEEDIENCNRNYSYPNQCHKSNQNDLPESQPVDSFSHNVMANIQELLQNSHTSCEGEKEKELAVAEQEHNVQAEMQARAHYLGNEEAVDPQIEAVRRQLLQFGISFIDPSSPSKNRPMLDSMYMPGLHNMLSVYQSTIVAPYHNVFRESDATVAKYLTDTHLAAIASSSPVMKSRSQKMAYVQERKPPGAYKLSDQSKLKGNNQIFEEFSNYDNNLSMATKKFLDKYGLESNN